MSKLLVNLLKVNERDFRAMIERLERACLQPSIDVSLGAEIVVKSRRIAAMLALDATDTTDEELYYGLRAKLIAHDIALNKMLKLTEATPHMRARKLTALATKLSKEERALCVSLAGCKRILTAVPPRRTLKLLKLRSLESVMKREDPRVLYTIALHIEDASWQTQVRAKMKRLQAKDFGWHTPEAVVIPARWFDKLGSQLVKHGLYLKSVEMGTLVVLPVMNNTRDGLGVFALGTLLQTLHQFTIDSTPYLQEGVLQGHEQILTRIIKNDTPMLQSVHGMVPSWAAVYELVVKNGISTQLPEVDLTIGELHWQSIETKIASYLPGFEFWVGSHFVGRVTQGVVVSAHFLDVAKNTILSTTYIEATSSHLEGSLWNELQLRYMQHDTISKAIVSQLHTNESLVI